MCLLISVFNNFIFLSLNGACLNIPIANHNNKETLTPNRGLWLIIKSVLSSNARFESGFDIHIDFLKDLPATLLNLQNCMKSPDVFFLGKEKRKLFSQIKLCIHKCKDQRSRIREHAKTINCLQVFNLKSSEIYCRYMKRPNVR